MRSVGAGWAALAVALVTIGVHATGLGGDFVYDDHRFIKLNESIRSVPFVAAFTDPETASHTDGITADIYRPLRTLLFAFQYQLFARTAVDGSIDFNLPLWHLVSILLHALNAVLVLLLLQRLLAGAVLPAALGALVFALHPLTSESVAWLSSQGDLLAVTLLLLGLLVMERPGLQRTVGGAVLFLLACLAKESALMLPLLLPLRDVALPRADAGRPSPWARTTWIRSGVLAGVAGLYFVLRGAVLPGLAQVPHVDGSVLATARTMLHGVGWYAQALLAPVGFSFDTRITIPLRWNDPEVWIGAGVLGTLLAAGVWGLARRRFVLAFAVLGVLVTLGPVSNVVVPLKTFVADRFLYPGLLCVAAGIAAGLAAQRGTSRSALLTVGLCVVIALGFLTTRRNAAWADELTLWQTVRADRPWNANAYQGIAFEYLAQKRIVDAENALATYLEANPFDGKSMYAMGNLFGEMAESLVLVGADAPGEETNVDVRRSQARVAQIKLYQRAFEIWATPGGLAIGRGSERMLGDMLNRWIDAGTALGDLGTARYANDQAIDLEGRGRFRHNDAEAVWAQASWGRKRVRVDLALRALRASADRRIPEGAARERMAAVRAGVLADCLLDPSLGDLALRPALIARFEQVLTEARAAEDLVPDPFLFADLSALQRGEGRLERARRVVAEGLEVHPGHPLLLAQQRALEGR
ncbi:MAG: hypothetical protein QNJ90_11305 [Planctomycetota bacterium]|nr:hypothetical protein [Planctomycetota bacterium]